MMHRDFLMDFERDPGSEASGGSLLLEVAEGTKAIAIFWASRRGRHSRTRAVPESPPPEKRVAALRDGPRQSKP